MEIGHLPDTTDAMRHSDSRYVIVYDVSCHRERRRVARILEGVGFRIQKSAFETRMTKLRRKSLVRELARLELRTGFVLIYRLQGGSGPEQIGVRSGDEPSEETHALVF